MQVLEVINKIFMPNLVQGLKAKLLWQKRENKKEASMLKYTKYIENHRRNSQNR